MQDKRGSEDHLTEVGFAAAFLIAAVATGLAVLFRVGVGPRITGEQAIFSYPAVIIVTLLAGRRAGTITAAICVILLWYFVIPYKHSFVTAAPSDAVALLVYGFVEAAFIIFLGRLRTLFYKHRKLAFDLQRRVHELTTQRARLWESVPEFAAVIIANGVIEAANPAFSAFVGVSPLELPERHLREFFSAEDYKMFRKAQKAILNDGEYATFQTGRPSFDKDGPISWSLVRDGDLSYLVGRPCSKRRHVEG